MRDTGVMNCIVLASGGHPFGTQTGERCDGKVLIHGGRAGIALFGGYYTLDPGQYELIVRIDKMWSAPHGSGIIEICGELAAIVVIRRPFTVDPNAEAPCIKIDFQLDKLMEQVEVRLFCDASFRACISQIELFSHPLPRQQIRPLHILYSSVHAALEYDEIRMLVDNGHKVFSLEGGAYHIPHCINPFRPSPPRLFQEADYERYMRTGLSAAFLEAFDAIIVMDQPRRIPTFCDLAPNVPVIYRSIGQFTPGREDVLRPYAGRACVVRYSTRELGVSGTAATDAVIYFGKYASDYDPDWSGGGPIMTMMNGFQTRNFCSAPNLEQYGRIAARFSCVLYGSENGGLALAQGMVPWRDLAQALKHASLYLMVVTTGPSYTLTFMEAMAAGTPIVAPTAGFIQANTPAEYLAYSCFDPVRYEVSALLQDDERVLFSSVEEAEEKIAWLLDNYDYRQMLSRRQRQTFEATFAGERIRDQWEELLQGLARAGGDAQNGRSAAL